MAALPERPSGACPLFLPSLPLRLYREIPLSARPAEYGPDGHEKDLRVEHKRPVVDVFQIELHPIFETDGVSSGNLPDARDAGLHRKPPAMPRLVFRNLRGQR